MEKMYHGAEFSCSLSEQAVEAMKVERSVLAGLHSEEVPIVPPRLKRAVQCGWC
jgi:hypothetical protein